MPSMSFLTKLVPLSWHRSLWRERGPGSEVPSRRTEGSPEHTHLAAPDTRGGSSCLGAPAQLPPTCLRVMVRVAGAHCSMAAVSQLQPAVGLHCKLLKPSGKHTGTLSKLFGSDCGSFPGAAEAESSFAAAALNCLG